MNLALKQKLITPSKRLITHERRQLHRAALPGLMPLPFVGRKPVIPGSASYTTPGTYALIIPEHRTFVFDVRGAGGGGGGAIGIDAFSGGTYPGATGGTGGYAQVYYEANSGLLNVIGFGGSGGAGTANGFSLAANGSGGAGQGGDTNITGGGNGPGAGASSTLPSGFWVVTGTPTTVAGTGGYGGRAVRTISQGLIATFGQRLIIIVGSGGGQGANGSPNNYIAQGAAGAGAPGAVYMSWS